MDQRVSLITLAVEDLAAERAFYEALGWEVTDATGAADGRFRWRGHGDES